MKCAAESARKERDVLADRSSVYLETISEYEGPLDRESLQNQEMLLIELEKLRSQIEEDRIIHAREIDELQVIDLFIISIYLFAKVNNLLRYFSGKNIRS